MRSVKLFMRLMAQEFPLIAFLGGLYILPVFARFIFHGKLVKNIIPFVILIPLVIYPVLFFIRGIAIIKKEWDNGTIIHYLASTFTPFEFTAGFSLFMLFEVFLLYAIPLVLFSLLSNTKGVIVQFTPYPASFFIPLPLFFLSYLFGYTLYLLSRCLYIKRNTVAFFAGILLLILYFFLYAKVKKMLPDPFVFHIITAGDHIVRKGRFLFVYPFFVSVLLFLIDLYLYKKAEY